MSRGPVELFFVTYPREQDVQRVVQALRTPVDNGHVAVIDLVMLTRGPDGVLTARDAEDELFPGPAFAGLHLDPHRLLSDDDLELLALSLDEDQEGVVLVLEHVWARTVTAALADLGAELGLHARIPAADVDAAFALEDAVG
jgi:hypothetical protein